jgi:CDGSH-type Zn-finger protein
MSDVKPEMPQKAPYPVEVEAGRTYFWCACGKSAKQPFCDGSHQGGPFEPLRFKAEKSGKVYLCGCKRTANAPYCDGTHNSC